MGTRCCRYVQAVATVALVVLVAACASEPQDDGTGDTTGNTSGGSTECPVYDPADYPYWIDADGDCQNTRAEVLISESQVPVTFTSGSACTVATGQWVDPYTGTTYTSAADLDIDHLVPLKEAHDSGAYAWDAATRRAFANDLDDPDALGAVSSSVNSSKGARDPAEWLPLDSAAQVWYAHAWVAVKRSWGLTADAAEIAALQAILEADALLPDEAPEAVCTASAGVR